MQGVDRLVSQDDSSRQLVIELEQRTRRVGNSGLGHAAHLRNQRRKPYQFLVIGGNRVISLGQGHGAVLMYQPNRPVM